MASGTTVSAVLCLVWLVFGCLPTSAQQPMSTEDIVNALNNNAAPTSSAQDVIDALENRIAVVGHGEKAKNSDVLPAPSELPDPAIALPALDFLVLFENNSHAINPNSFPMLMNLADALSNSAFEGKRFLIAGHTDAKGSDAHNLDLSIRRADSVKSFLAAVRPSVVERLVAMGFGERQLKNKTDPLASENRRVQVVNLGR